MLSSRFNSQLTITKALHEYNLVSFLITFKLSYVETVATRIFSLGFVFMDDACVPDVWGTFWDLSGCCFLVNPVIQVSPELLPSKARNEKQSL